MTRTFSSTLLLLYFASSCICAAQSLRILPRFPKGKTLEYHRYRESTDRQKPAGVFREEKESDSLTVIVRAGEAAEDGSVTLHCSLASTPIPPEPFGAEGGGINVIRVSESQAMPLSFSVRLDSNARFVSGLVEQNTPWEMDSRERWKRNSGRSDSALDYRQVKWAADYLFKLDKCSPRKDVAIGDRWIDSLPGPVTTSSHIFPRIKTAYHAVDGGRAADGTDCIRYSIREVRTPWNTGEEPNKRQSRGIEETTFLYRRTDGCLLERTCISRAVFRGDISSIGNVDDIMREVATTPEISEKVSWYLYWNERVTLRSERD